MANRDKSESLTSASVCLDFDRQTSLAAGNLLEGEVALESSDLLGAAGIGQAFGFEFLFPFGEALDVLCGNTGSVIGDSKTTTTRQRQRQQDNDNKTAGPRDTYW
jgi:hypothetical protein